MMEFTHEGGFEKILKLSSEQMSFNTVVPKLNQGFPKTAVHRFRVCFFGTFLHKQKSTGQNIVLAKKTDLGT